MREVSYGTDELLAQLRVRGYVVEGFKVFDQGDVEIERLADLIAGGETRAALELLKELAPNAPEPTTTLFLRDLRASQSEV